MMQILAAGFFRIGLAGLVAVTACACAPSSSNTGGATGGSTGTGTGGNAGTGGVTGSGGGGTGTGGLGTGGRGGGGGVVGSGGAIGSGGSGGAIGSGGSGGRGGSGGMSGSGGIAPGTGGATGGTSGTGGAVPPSSSGLPVPPGPASLPRPSGTPGNITVLNWAGWKGAVSYTFDDATSSQIQRYPQLQALAVPYTFYLWTGKTEASNAIWGTAVKDGHELGNHTKSHQSDGTVEDIDAATQFIMSKWGVTPWTMAAPNGALIYTTLANGRFMINRGVANTVVLPNDNSDPFKLPCYVPPTGAPASAFNTQVDGARSAGGWRIMVIHGFTGGSDGAYQPVPFDEFANGVKYAKSLGDMWIGRVDTIGAYWLGQKAFSQATTTTTGGSTTWKWKLPDHFPPGKFLRVTVPGGTLKQDGAELRWDGHGYYEIALDRGSVTVSP